MFTSLIEHAKLQVSSTATRYIGRVVVGLLFLIAVAFAVAAAYIKLAESFGAIAACAMMAALFAVLALVVAMIVVLQQRHQEALLKQTAQSSAIFSGLMSASPTAIMGGARLARLVGRRAPLLALGALAGGLILARSMSSSDSGSGEPRNEHRD